MVNKNIGIPRYLLLFLIDLLALPFLIFAIFLCYPLKYLNKQKSKKIVCGGSPIINFSYYAKALQRGNYIADSYVSHCFNIHKSSDWDFILELNFKTIPRPFKNYLAFIYILLKYDIFITTFRGFFIGGLPLGRFQFNYIKLAGKKSIVIPYGSDSFVYRRISLPRISHCLQINYSQAARNQFQISRNLDHIISVADAVIPGIMSFEGFGRWDVITPCQFFLDLDEWKQTTHLTKNNGRDGKVVIAHTPNHRGVKGTEYLIEAVKILKEEGLKIELRLFEGVLNSTIKDALQTDVDILVEQLNGFGYALSGLEGLASGLTVISSNQDNEFIEPFRTWSFFDECPIVGSSCKNVVNDLRILVTSPHLRKKLGSAGREYAVKYHGFDSAQYLFKNVFDYIYGKKDSIINLYHPILGEYTNRLPKIKHPLQKNRISGVKY
jgi:glycosyltransferase involved in cell wall biosynthesis